MKIKTCKEFINALNKKKYYVLDEETQLKRVLNTFDLTALGIGNTLGVGVYVLAGEVSKHYAGPSVIISFLIAAIASTLAGLCYAEFGVRVPKAGSAYEYAYVCIGEFTAFMVGWNLILEHSIGSASVAKGLFTYLDALTFHVMSEFFREHMPINSVVFAPFPDFFSFGVILVFALALALGAKDSLILNNIFTVVNILVVLFVIISGLWKVNIDNWRIPKDQVPEKYGDGGFAPYGITGILTGSATCFYGFIGFAIIATAAEEAKTPKKSIPIAVTVSLIVVFLAYFGISTVITMILPYYEQDDKAPLPHVYDMIGWTVAKYVVSVGALCGLLSSLLGSLFQLPRIVYAMSFDGLLFAFLGKVHSKFGTPLVGTLCAGLVTGIMACLLELSDLFKMMAIGTLVAYSIVAACVLILKYKEVNKKYDEQEAITASRFCAQMFNTKLKAPTKLTCRIVVAVMILFTIFSFLLAATMTQFMEEMANGVPWTLSVIVFCGSMIILSLTSMSCQPNSIEKLDFAVPFIPWLPACSMLINIFLMVLLDAVTWARYAVWMGVGLLTYFCYGVWHSKTINRNTIDLPPQEGIKE